MFSAAPGDLAVADCADGPVILARPGKHKAVAFGFHPGRTAMRFELATPLLFANILRWMAPEVFRRWELNGGSVGTVTAALDPGVDPAEVRVLAEGGRSLPFTIEDNSLRFFTATPGTVRVLAGNRETVFSLTLPDVADARWEPPRAMLRGLPAPGGPGPPLARSGGSWPWRERWDCSSSGCCSARGGSRHELRPRLGLLFAVLPAAWAAWEWRRTARKAALVLKLSAFLCVVLALSEPGLRVSATRMAVAILVDTSSSVSEQDLKHASQLVSAMEKARGRHWVRVLPFARSARQMDPGERAPFGKLRHTAGEAGEATDLEAALREALATLPAGLVPRVALISDGKENRGSIARGAALLEQLGVPVDTFPLAGRPKPELVIEQWRCPRPPSPARGSPSIWPSARRAARLAWSKSPPKANRSDPARWRSRPGRTSCGCTPASASRAPSR